MKKLLEALRQTFLDTRFHSRKLNKQRVLRGKKCVGNFLNILYVFLSFCGFRYKEGRKLLSFPV